MKTKRYNVIKTHEFPYWVVWDSKMEGPLTFKFTRKRDAKKQANYLNKGDSNVG